MKQNLYIPTCYKFLNQKDGTPDYQRIYSVSKSAFNLKYPDQEIDDQVLFNFLQANSLLPSSMSIDEMDTQKLDLCFSVISQYKCNSICQLCGYSPLYTNQLETEESILLGYSISNWKNLQLLLNAGVTCRLFRSRIPVSETSAIPVVPLNRLAFEYLETIPESQDDLLDVPAKIVASLKENNKGKLSAADFKIILRYLENLYNSKYQYTEVEVITSILKNHYRLSLKATDTTKESLQKPTITSPLESQFLEGFLGAKKPVKTLTRNAQQEIPDKKTINSINENNPLPSPQTREAKITMPDTVRNIQYWEMTVSDFNNSSVINLEEADTYQIELFKNALLRMPILPAEIVKHEKKDWLIVYALEKYYIYEKNNPLLLDILTPYITKSKYRKLLCFEPYQLLSYLYHYDVFDLELFSIRIFMDIYDAESTWALAPAQVLQHIYPFQNPDHSSSLIFCMRNYQKAYNILLSKYADLSDTLYSQYEKKLNLTRLLGYSYDLSKICQKSKFLFQSEERAEYIFCYDKTESVHSPYIAIQFTIHWNSKEPFNMVLLLENMVSLKIPYKYDCYLLSYDTEELHIALPEKYYSFICETIYHISYKIAKKENKLPLTIDEKK